MSTIFHPAMSAASSQHLESLTASITPELPLDKSSQDYWVAYGSIVLNALTPESDIDMLYVARDSSEKPFRHQANFQDRPVTVYAVNEDTLDADGAPFLYGGYFSGKLLSPHVVLADTPEDSGRAAARIEKTVGNFMANFIDLKAGTDYSAEEVAAETLNAYLDLCPWYQTYLIKFFNSPAGESLFTNLPKHYVSSLLAADVIAPTDAGFQPVTDTAPESPDTKARNKIRAISRFWSYGAIEHGNDHLFGDFYFDKAEASGAKLDPTGAIWKDISSRLGVER